MEQTADLPPVVWKSNFYFTPQAFEPLWKHIDTFIADFKFGNNECAESLCGGADYVETVTTALLTVYHRNPHRLIVRHLLLPGHFDCCFMPILDWFAGHIPGAMFSLWEGYLPAWHAKNDPLLNSWLDPNDAIKAKEQMRQRRIRIA
jgi:putative pyruvate formate lyase activating enzyme